MLHWLQRHAVFLVFSTCAFVGWGWYKLLCKWNHKYRHIFFDAQDCPKDDRNAFPASAQSGTFQPLLGHYISVTQLLITVAAASIAFGGTNSPPGVGLAKIFLSCSVLYGVFFCAVLLYRYDEYSQDVRSYTLKWYATVESAGFSTLTCFAIGYVWWAVAVISIAPQAMTAPR